MFLVAAAAFSILTKVSVFNTTNRNTEQLPKLKIFATFFTVLVSVIQGKSLPQKANPWSGF
jgi:hypothetical protein